MRDTIIARDLRQPHIGQNAEQVSRSTVIALG
jgi:hypothetical protein